MHLTVEKVRTFGDNGGIAYRASVEGDSIALAKTKAAAAAEALATLYSAYATCGNPPAMARLADGQTLIGTEIDRESYALWYFAADGTRQMSSAMGNRTINGRACTLGQYVRYNALLLDGMDGGAAAAEVFASEGQI